MSVSGCYASLARMLDYPENKDTILAACGSVSGFFRERRIGPPPDPFAEFVEASTLSRLQEEYVATFDFNPAVAPYLGHHLYGDDRKKGAYLIRLKQEFGRHGFLPSGCELPDHLPLVLEFLARLAERREDGARRSFLSECVLPGMERLSAGFSVRAESPWKSVVDATRILCAADACAREEETPC
ncbi:MAG: nitrate reductase molybdenum cofactor assembly chaperone [Deltaproteobacteria bacterium]|nr:nitrate reductase molybdenum cofactor assembly chaperone [Deltaproteobacteria bacterium]PWB66898.1 MAG: nitrate reductase molybdenum cofactor assembly chaperone [Deltaproteobacteria bacterium]